jgi:hypothetical protein
MFPRRTIHKFRSTPCAKVWFGEYRCFFYFFPSLTTYNNHPLTHRPKQHHDSPTLGKNHQHHHLHSSGKKCKNSTTIISAARNNSEAKMLVKQQKQWHEL